MPGPAALIFAGARKVSWSTVIWVSREAFKRGSAANRALGPKRRARLSELIKASKGLPANLSQKEREEIGELVRIAIDAAKNPDVPPTTGP